MGSEQLGVAEVILCRRRPRRRPLQQLISFVAVLLVFSCSSRTCTAQFAWTTHIYQNSQLDSLQALWGAWNGSTPELATNLEGWSSTVVFPCSEDYTVAHPNWRGVECLNYVGCIVFVANGGTYRNCSTYITGLTLDKASIAGILPPAIGDISTLTALELTGNPELTGELPETMLNLSNLYNLHLQDNNFSGEVPAFQHLLNVNLSGNHFKSGHGSSFPLATMRSAQKVSLDRNDFEGQIPGDAFVGMKSLVLLDLSNNRFNGTPPNLTEARSLQILNLSNNSFTGTLPDLTSLPSLRTVYLSGNAFTGPAPDFWNSSELQDVYLDNNSLDGSLDIAKLSSQGLLSTRSASSSGQLRVLSLTYNNISHVVYDPREIENITTIISLKGNPYCVNEDLDDGTRCFCKQICLYQGKAKADKRKIVIIAAVTSVSSFLLLLAGLAVLYYRYSRYRRYLQLQVQQKFDEFEVKPTIFPYTQLRTATRDFHPEMKLGQGSFGAVYKGILPNGNVVAVKQLFAKSTQGIDEFLNEVVLLTGMKHRNLVNLKGCCIREQQRLLVYEYVDNYDIDKILLSSNQGSKALLSWPVRLKMCLGVAHGLHYLHAHAQPRIIHRDIKAGNILLAKNYETKIADFGLAFLFPDEESYVMTKHVAGTKGYLAPEYASYGQLSDKVDVFSFGVLCLEIVSGRRNIDEKLAPNEMYLLKWAWELRRRGSLMDMVDPRMSLQDEEKAEVHRVINIALLCIQSEAEQRPNIEKVLAMLQGDGESEPVALQPEMEEEYLEDIRLFAVGNTGLATVMEEGEASSLMNSSRRGMHGSEDTASTGATLELTDIRVR